MSNKCINNLRSNLFLFRKNYLYSLSFPAPPINCPNISVHCLNTIAPLYTRWDVKHTDLTSLSLYISRLGAQSLFVEWKRMRASVRYTTMPCSPMHSTWHWEDQRKCWEMNRYWYVREVVISDAFNRKKKCLFLSRC